MTKRLCLHHAPPLLLLLLQLLLLLLLAPVNDVVLLGLVHVVLHGRSRRYHIQFTVAHKLQDYQAYPASGAHPSERNPRTA